jgi:phage baseplate assembly protein W
VLTNFGERLFQPNVGGNVNRALFGLADEVTASNIVYDIKQTIKANESRANLLDVKVYPSPDRNSFIVDVIFSVINSQTPIALNLVLRRAR